MESEEIKALTKEWLLTMLFRNPCHFGYLLENGCNTIIYGHDTADDIKKILNEMIKDDLIKHDSFDDQYWLTNNGNFMMMKNTINPLRDLLDNPERLEAFLNTNRDACDVTFLKTISSPTFLFHARSDIIAAIAKELHKFMRNGFPVLRELLVFVRGDAA